MDQQHPEPKPAHKLKFAVILLILFLLAPAVWLYRYYPSQPLLSPLSELIDPLLPGPVTPVVKPNKIVYGFLPYWNIKYHPNFRYHLLTHLAYFGVDYQPDGSIMTRTADGNQEPGWRHLNSDLYRSLFSKMANFRGKNILVLRGMETETITGIVNTPANRDRAISSTLDLLSEYDFDGLNIDFEYMGTPTQATRDNFTLFVKDLSIACKRRRPDCEISIDVFADSVDKVRLWDYPMFVTYVDYVIMMAYDYHRPSSVRSGPVAPLRGSCTSSSQGDCFSSDVSLDIARLTKIIPPEKILLGVPYYGYQWQTSGTDIYANTYPQTGSTASYERVRQLLDSESSILSIHKNQQVYDLQPLWDFNSLSPRLIFEDSKGHIQQIYYEDERSLSLKYDLVNQSGLAGIAIWALGYDGSYPQLWQLLSEKFYP